MQQVSGQVEGFLELLLKHLQCHFFRVDCEATVFFSPEESYYSKQSLPREQRSGLDQGVLPIHYTESFNRG